jgi:hypothetical protein
MTFRGCVSGASFDVRTRKRCPARSTTYSLRKAGDDGNDPKLKRTTRDDVCEHRGPHRSICRHSHDPETLSGAAGFTLSHANIGERQAQRNDRRQPYLCRQ